MFPHEHFNCWRETLVYFCFSIGRSACISNTNNQVIKQAFADDWASMPVQDFRLVNETRRTLTRSGKIFFTLPLEEQLSVLEGDILGLHWESSSAGQLIRQAPTANPVPGFQVEYDSVGFAARNTTEYQLPNGQAVSTHAGDFLVMAHVIRPMIFKVNAFSSILCKFLFENLTSKAIGVEPRLKQCVPSRRNS